MFSVFRFLAALSIIFMDSIIGSLFCCYCRWETWLLKPIKAFMLFVDNFFADLYAKFINETYPTLPIGSAPIESFLSLLHLRFACLAFWSITIAENLEFFEAGYFGSFIFLCEVWFSLVNWREAVL